MSAESLFHPVVWRWFCNHFQRPTPPQSRGWPVIAGGKNTLILAPTGSGKTLAAFLWSIDELVRLKLEAGKHSAGIHSLYISPLKALNNDIHRNLQEPLNGISAIAAGEGLNPPHITALVRTGDTPSHIRQAMVRKPPDILITTPESLYLLLTSVRGREIFRGLRYIIVDEIHALSNNKRGVHLSLSLERLMPLCRREPIRIGLSATQRPLGRIAAFLGGQRSTAAGFRPRPVTIVDCGQKKDRDVRVISPVEDFQDLPQATVWPAVIQKLYDLIQEHKTTLVFVNMRAQTERVARLLNEMHTQKTGENSLLALAHHGSISREVRYDIESQLKAGTIRAVVATASLELGIDIGSIDLVVQLESPRSVSGALQRVGRSGHALKATSKGRIIPLYQSDLDDAVALTEEMFAGNIEETQIPENCLDVLAQQIVAEVAMRDWPRPALFQLVRQSFCYRHLSGNLFNSVVSMLAGRFADAPLQALQARISWDRVNDRLHAMRGAPLLATMNGGTIPDRGYYSVYLNGTNTRLGEMEEEFVFESRVGHVFFLGNNEWRIDEIHQDRILVSPLKSVKPRAPFWKGDLLYRDFETSRKIGAFRRRFFQPQAGGVATPDTPHADENACKNLSRFLQRQRQHTGGLPSDRRIIVESFCDSADEPHYLVHTCFGARVNGLWAIALAAAAEKQYGTQVQYAFDDDGIIMRTMDVAGEFSVDKLMRLPAQTVEQILTEVLLDTPAFSIRFRYNAARALILSRSQPGKRIPLWLQRLRAADLLQIVRRYPDFPIIIETYRDCFEDLFDLGALKKVCAGIRAGDILIETVRTPSPSPMASGLMFNFLSENIYETDRSRLPGTVASVSSEMLADILARESIPAIIPRQLVTEAENRWQHLAPHFQARDRESLFRIIEKLAPINERELGLRSRQNPRTWLRQLFEENRIFTLHEPAGDWVPASDVYLFGEKPDDSIVQERVRRFLATRGPVTVSDLCASLPFAGAALQQALKKLQANKDVVSGRLTTDAEAQQWCDRLNFAELYRKAIAQRRQNIRPAGPSQFTAFQFRWHKLARPEQDLRACLLTLGGLQLTPEALERDILPSRFFTDDFAVLEKQYAQADGLISRGEIIVTACRADEDSRTRIRFLQRGSGALFIDKAHLQANVERLNEEETRVYEFLVQQGASFVPDIVAATQLQADQVRRILGTLARNGLVSCESYRAFLTALKNGSKKSAPAAPSWLPERKFSGARSGRRARRAVFRTHVRQDMLFDEARWFLTTSFAVMGKPPGDEEKAEKQARLLLQRYGIVAKERYRRECAAVGKQALSTYGYLPWFRLFQAMKRMEWRGEIRRGYFAAGLSGVQFALPQAVALLEEIQTTAESEGDVPEVSLLSSVDPASPLLDSQLTDADGNDVRVVRLPSNHFVFAGLQPVFYSENYGTRLWQITAVPQELLSRCCGVFKRWLQLPAHLRPKKRLIVEQINGCPAAESPLAAQFLKNGFEAETSALILWPSAI